MKLKFKASIGIREMLTVSFCIIAITPILIFGISESSRWEKESFENSEKITVSLADAICLDIQQVIESRLTALETVTELVAEKGGHGPQVQKTLGLYREKFKLGSLFVIGTNGYSTAAFPEKKADGTTSIGIDYRDRDYFKEMQINPKIFVSSIRFSRITGKAAFQIAVPLWDTTKTKWLGLIGSSITSSEIFDVASQSLSAHKDISVIIADSTHHVVTRTSNSDPKEIEDYSEFSLFKKPPHLGVTGVDLKNNEIFGTIVPVLVSGQSWFVVVYRPLAAVKASAIVAKNITLKLASLILLIVLCLGWLGSVIISRPILQLIRAIELLPVGESKQWLAKVFARGFIRELTTAWESLKTTAEALDDHTNNLQQMVAERTEELIRANHDLELQRAQAVETAKFASLGEMAGGIAHEINNPLAIISGKAEATILKIESGNFDKNKTLEDLTKITANVQRISKIIKGLRSFSRNTESDPMALVPIKQIISDTLELCSERFRNNAVELKVAPIPNLALMCRAAQLSQVLLNLLNNAFDAIESFPEKWISLSFAENESKVFISVEDCGLGIKAEVIAKMMEPFFSTKAVGKGTGLGLSISKGIIESHSGKLSYDTSSLHTKFVIELPKYTS